MNKLIVLFLGLVLVGCGDSGEDCGLYRCPMKPTEILEQTLACEAMGMKAEYREGTLGVLLVRCVDG